MSVLCGVVGHPIAHSKSPEIHAQFAAQCGVDLCYERVLAPLDGFVATVAGLRARGFVGCNVTVPFKLEAFGCAQVCSPDVVWAGAANTLSFGLDGAGAAVVRADNTDGVGLVRDVVVNLGVALRGRRVLLLGAGGAARGVLRPILAQGPAGVWVKNRSLARAVAWRDEVAGHADFAAVCAGAGVFVSGWDDVVGLEGGLEAGFDVVINATAGGLDDSFVPPVGVVLARGALAYDMMYGRETRFLSWARSEGAVVADGWGMLVEQAAASFALWHGVVPSTASLLVR